MDGRLAKTLYKWARDNEENQTKLETWLNEAVTAIAEGKGSQIMSATGNGVSVNLAPAGMTVTSWANTLSVALSYLENAPANSNQAVIL